MVRTCGAAGVLWLEEQLVEITGHGATLALPRRLTGRQVLACEKHRPSGFWTRGTGGGGCQAGV